MISSSFLFLSLFLFLSFSLFPCTRPRPLQLLCSELQLVLPETLRSPDGAADAVEGMEEALTPPSPAPSHLLVLGAWPPPPPCCCCCCCCCWLLLLLSLSFELFSCSLSSLMASSSFFSFIRRFWNQILICLSVRHSMWDSSMRRRRVR